MLEEYSLVRLFDDSADDIITHIDSLGERDRYLRFGYNPPTSRVTEYVTKSLSTVNIRTCADFWFGIKQGSELVATLHTAIREDVAEFAFTTAEAHRGKKLGQLLFARGYQLVTEYSIDRIYIIHLRENSVMAHIARKFGLGIINNEDEIERSLQLLYPVEIGSSQQMLLQIKNSKYSTPTPT